MENNHITCFCLNSKYKYKKLTSSPTYSRTLKNEIATIVRI